MDRVAKRERTALGLFLVKKDHFPVVAVADVGDEIRHQRHRTFCVGCPVTVPHDRDTGIFAAHEHVLAVENQALVRRGGIRLRNSIENFNSLQTNHGGRKGHAKDDHSD